MVPPPVLAVVVTLCTMGRPAGLIGGVPFQNSGVRQSNFMENGKLLKIFSEN
jgi:hypothetical protein